MIELSRDVVATTIPYGQKTTLSKGSQVEITQELGGSFTVLTDYGLLRIEGKDADALGRASAAPLAEPVAAPTDAKSVATEIWNQLKSCYDPEIPENIVELGLVYENKVEPRPDGGFKKEANIEVVFDPPWNQSMMSEAAKLQLGML